MGAVHEYVRLCAADDTAGASIGIDDADDFYDRRHDAVYEIADRVVSVFTRGAGFFDQMTCNSIGPSLTCDEAWFLSDVLTAVGFDDLAAALITGHAAGDDEESDCKGDRYDSAVVVGPFCIESWS